MKLSAKLPPDDQGAKLMRFENVRGRRYWRITIRRQSGGGPVHLPPTCRLPYLSAALATAGACAWRAAGGAEVGLAPACTAWVA
jgi:hypothetical protein